MFFFVKNYPEHLVLGYQYINNLSNDIFLKLLKNSFLHLKCVLNLGARHSMFASKYCKHQNKGCGRGEKISIYYNALMNCEDD